MTSSDPSRPTKDRAAIGGSSANSTVGEVYQRSRERLSASLTSLNSTQWEVAVPACPGWSVHDVVAHLVGVIEDSAAGLLNGPPNPEQTAAEVARHQKDAPSELLQAWTSLSPQFERAITEFKIWPACIDALTHEHDILAALQLPYDANSDDVREIARGLTRGLPSSISVALDGQLNGNNEAPVRLSTTSYEFFRLRLGRRSARQIQAMDWNPAPPASLDGLVVFGPTEHDLIE